MQALTRHPVTQNLNKYCIFNCKKLVYLLSKASLCSKRFRRVFRPFKAFFTFCLRLVIFCARPNFRAFNSVQEAKNASNMRKRLLRRLSKANGVYRVESLIFRKNILMSWLIDENKMVKELRSSKTIASRVGEVC